VIDTGRRYTAQEAAGLARQGYELRAATTLDDSEPMFIVTGYRAPSVPRGLSEDNHAGWEAP
jgi:hypothetical protein